MGKGVLWNGKYYLIPQAASRIDSSALANSPLGGANKVVLMSDVMTGLIPPKTPFKINSPSLALQLLNPASEEARLGAQLLFDPSPSSQGASEVYLLAVNPSVQGTVTHDTKLILTSYMYGILANQIKSKIETGTTSGKKVTVQFQDNVETFDNLGKDSFSVQYTGAAATSILVITPTVAGHVISTTNAGNVDNVSFDMAVYTTIQSVVDAFNATGKYTATVITAKPKDDLSMDLDAVLVGASQSIKSSAYTATSNLKAIVDAINKGSGYVAATRVADASTAPANSAAWVYLASGSDGTTTSTDWDNALNSLKTRDYDLIVPLTSNTSYHAKVDSHCREMSGPNGKSERRCFVGGALQAWTSEANRVTAVAALIAASKALGSDRTVLAGLGSKHYDPSGNIKLYPAYITACMYAGIAGGSTPVEPLTKKYLRCLGLEIDLRVSEIESLLETNGVAVPIPDVVRSAGYLISRQLTTWNADDDLYRIEFSVGRGADYIAREIRKRHEDLTGKPGTESLDITIVNLTNAVLDAAKRENYIRNYDPKKTQLRVDGTIRYVDYYAEPILPINWIFSTYHLQPTKFSIGL